MRIRRLGALVAIVAVWFGGFAGHSDAHTSVKRTSPAVGATVATGVDEIVIEFFDAVLPTPSVAISGPRSPITTGEPVLLAGQTAVRQAVGGVGAVGEYRVDVDFTSTDGDRQEFSFTFTVGAAVTGGDDAGDDGLFLPVDLDAVRLVLHVLAATIWVGGQLVLAGLVGTLRSLGEDAPRVAARQFNRIAWPAFAVLVITGLWNLTAIDLADRSGAYQATLVLKLVLVGVSGIGAALHSLGGSRVRLAVGGAAAGLGAVAALFVGVLLAHG